MKKTESKAFKAKTDRIHPNRVQALKVSELSGEQVNAILTAKISWDDS